MESLRQDPAGGSSRDDSGKGGPPAAAAAAFLREVRLRALERATHAPPRLSLLRRWALFLAILLHVVIVAGLRVALRRPPVARDQTVVQVDLIAAPKAAPPLPVPAPLPHAARPERRNVPAAVQAQAAAAAPLQSPAEPEPRLFSPDGSALVPDELAAEIDRARPKPDFIPRRYSPSPLLQPRRPLKVRPNHFAQYWAGTDGMTAYDAMWRHVTFVKEFTAPWGGRYACAWVLIIVACGDVPQKAWVPPTRWKPATELDAR